MRGFAMSEQPAPKSELRRIIEFGLVGVANTAIDFIVFNLLLILGVPATIGSGISFLAANLNGYILNRQWTFGDKKTDKVATQYSQYLLAGVVGFLINVGIVNLGAQYVTGLPEWVVLNGSKLVAIILTIAWNYITSRFLIFDKPKYK
jgi:putative flippase GtrA